MFNISDHLGDFSTNVIIRNLTGGAPGQACPANPNRAAIWFCLDVGQAIYLCFPEQVAARTPQRILQPQAQLNMTWILDGYLTTLEWWYTQPNPIGTPKLVITELIWQP